MAMNWFESTQLRGHAEIMISSISSWAECRKCIHVFSELYGGESTYMDYDSETDKIGFNPNDEFVDEIKHRARQLIISSNLYKLNIKYEDNIAMIWFSVKNGRFPISIEIKPIVQNIIATNKNTAFLIGHEIDLSINQVRELITGSVPNNIDNQGILSILIRMATGYIIAHDFLTDMDEINDQVSNILSVKNDMIEHVLK